MKIALVGAGGYGLVYLRFFSEGKLDPARFTLCAAIDVNTAAAAEHPYIKEHDVPVYASLEEFYRHDTADLVIISTPIQLHREQTVLAFSHGSHVLCEKPITATPADAIAMQAAANETGRLLGVGFQWSFCDSNAAFKRDLREGVFGRPVCLRCKMSWPRKTTYYSDSPWKGRYRDAHGNRINDCVITNATAHYLHNIFFVTDSAPANYRYAAARAHKIETLDTCIIRGQLTCGADFFFAASHATTPSFGPYMEYKFERGTVYFAANEADDLYAVMNDGTRRSYGPMQVSESKVIHMADAIEAGSAPRCTVKNVLPHLTLCNEILSGKIETFPEERIVRGENDSLYVPGLWEKMERAYDTLTVPDSLL